MLEGTPALIAASAGAFAVVVTQTRITMDWWDDRRDKKRKRKKRRR